MPTFRERRTGQTVALALLTALLFFLATLSAPSGALWTPTEGVALEAPLERPLELAASLAQLGFSAQRLALLQLGLFSVREESAAAHTINRELYRVAGRLTDQAKRVRNRVVPIEGDAGSYPPVLAEPVEEIAASSVRLREEVAALELARAEAGGDARTRAAAIGTLSAQIVEGIGVALSTLQESRSAFRQSGKTAVPNAGGTLVPVVLLGLGALGLGITSQSLLAQGILRRRSRIDLKGLLRSAHQALEDRLDPDTIIELQGARYVVGEPRCLEEVLSSLIETSSLYARPGIPLHIRISAEEGERYSVVTFDDNGAPWEPQLIGLPGVSPTVSWPVLGGHGDRLWAAAELVRRWGGALAVEERFGTGNRIVLRFPR